MNQNEFLANFKRLQDEAFSIVGEKNAAYSRFDDAFSNFKRGRQSVPEKVWSRMEDKISRIENLLFENADASPDESIRDSLLDLANYALILAIALETEVPKHTINSTIYGTINSQNQAGLSGLVKIKKLDDLPLPTYAHEGDVGCDLYSTEDVTLKVGERAVVGTGIAFTLPYGVGMFVMPRSGLALKNGITVLNAPGVVDVGFRDEVGVILINHGDVPFTVCRGMRIAQAVFLPFVRMGFVEVDDLSPSERTSERTGGFGHTGV